jgi:hypothetical protein
VSTQRHRTASGGHRGGRSDSGDAFFPDPGDGPIRLSDDLAEELAEEFVSSATTGQEQGEEGHEQFVEEEIGGPFVTTSSSTEFAHGFDASNIPGTVPEAYPTSAARASDLPDAEDREDPAPD